MSKVGITTLVKLWCNLVSPKIPFISLCRYLPSYFGPLKTLETLTSPENIPLYIFIFEQLKQNIYIYICIIRLCYVPCCLGEDFGGMLEIERNKIFGSIQWALILIGRSKHSR